MIRRLATIGMLAVICNIFGYGVVSVLTGQDMQAFLALTSAVTGGILLSGVLWVYRER